MSQILWQELLGIAQEAFRDELHIWRHPLGRTTGILPKNQSPTVNLGSSGDGGAGGVSGVLTVNRGGTGLASYEVGDLLYASGITTLAKLADVATGNALISGGVGLAPSWGKIGLTTHVSGVLGAGGGGTGVNNSTRTLTISSNSGTLLFSSVGSTVTFPATGTVPLGTGTDTQLTYWSGTNTQASSPLLIFDGANLGVGGAPAALLDVRAATGTIIRATSTKNASWSVGESAAAIELYKTDGSAPGAGVAGALRILAETGSGGTFALGIYGMSAAALDVKRAHIDSSGRLRLGVDLDPATAPNAILYTSGDGAIAGNIISQAADTVSPAELTFRKTRGTHASRSAVASGDIAGRLVFTAYNDDYRAGAYIYGIVESGVGASGADMPMTIRLATSPDGTAVPTDKMSILSGGEVGIGTTSPAVLLDVSSNSIRVRASRSPASNAAGNAGEICWDASYLYVCTATNTWERVALTGGY